MYIIKMYIIKIYIIKMYIIFQSDTNFIILNVIERYLKDISDMFRLHSKPNFRL